ncbi:glycoside hydrolase family 3 C-terminal domain-containing protein [Novisyntrophococcus fermenticellae]|uniref:glycoside hydrolase family 3 C-terminal domain-containing protein n=1 Tax=Novisyntrophococcus fermenticellae TaxID=2068655 RepID=UPI001E284D86|nr:glycoside hydrolase family 3 C-terminal domain-containing protein [Novisyntrophococcus fermenticellae]
MSEHKIGIPLEGFGEASRRAAAEGMVLLKNEGAMLPLTEKDCVSLFGRCQIDYYRSGTGSGGAVHVTYISNLLDALREQRNVCINEELAENYEAWIKEHPFDDGGGMWAGEPWHQEEMPVTEETAKRAAQLSNKAVVVIGRTAGEDQDNAAVEGSYLLSAQEQEMIQAVTRSFDQVAVVLNVSNIMDMSWLDTLEHKENIRAVLYSWQGGSEGGNACARILAGVAAPSGKLTDTIAYAIEDYPSTANFGGAEKNYYQEDIYVGYRYFETFAPDRVRFPFGFGLSYTDFTIEETQIKIFGLGKEAWIHIRVRVKNSGSVYAGKEVVQVYFEAPQGRLGKPARVLAGFAKTDLLFPGATQELTVDFPVAAMASYDDSGAAGHRSCWVLEPGQYKIYAGTDVKHAVRISSNEEALYIKECLVIEQQEEVLAPVCDYSRLRPGTQEEDGRYEITYERVPKQKISLEERIRKNLPRELQITGDRGIRFQDVKEQKAGLEEFVAQLSKEELSRIVRGEGMCSPLVTPGTASAFGGVAESLFHYGIPAACTADGPSGIRMDSGLKATQLPIGTLLASTWNLKLVEELYELEGEELLRNEVDTLLGPGINIHRNPMNGRNFEYFSEDPLVTGRFAAAVVRGIAKSGAAATVKHYACNNQEYGRNTADSIVSERAMREIYLKGFELAVKEGDARSIMTSYNPVNGHWSASNYDLCTTVLRGEWNYTGIVMTDWWAKMNDPVLGGKADISNTAAMVRAQNDLYMVVPNGGAEENAHEDNLLEALEEGRLTIGELQRSALNICRFILQSPAAQRAGQTAADVRREAKGFSFETVRFVPAESERFHVQLEHSGRYKFLVKVRSPLSEVAQSSCNLLMNGQAVVTIQTNGTGGEWTLIKLNNIYLEAGAYEITFEPVKPGLEIQWVDMTR